MESKKAKNQKFALLPLDCICHILTFYGSVKDYFSLVQVVKGLYEHVSFIFPKSTMNIPFNPKYFPTRTIHHVTNIKITRLSHFHFSNFGSKNVEAFIDSFLCLFPNLDQLEILFASNVDEIVDLNFTSQNMKFTKSSLRVLNLSYSCKDVVFDPPNVLSRLESFSMSVRKCGDGASTIVDIEEYINRMNNTDPSRNKLEINWKKLPRLNHFQISGFTLLSDLQENAKSRLEILNLLDSSVPKDSLTGLNELTQFTIRNEVGKVENLEAPNLQELNMMVESGTQTIHFDISNRAFKFLEKIEIGVRGGHGGGFGEDPDPELLYNGRNVCLFLTGFRYLRKLSLTRIKMAVRFDSLSSPLKVKLDRCTDVDLMEENLSLSVENITHLDLSEAKMGKILKQNLYRMMNIRSIQHSHEGSGRDYQIFSDEESRESDEETSVVGFNELRKLDLGKSEICAKKVTDCQQLRHLVMRQGRGKDLELMNLPNLRRLDLCVDPGSAIEAIDQILNLQDSGLERLGVHFPHLINLDSTFEQLTNCIKVPQISFSRVQNVELDGENMSKVRAFSFTPKYGSYFFRGRYIDSAYIRNYPNLSKIGFSDGMECPIEFEEGIIRDSRLPDKLTLVNLPRLESLGRLRSKPCSEMPEKNMDPESFHFHLQDLPSLKTLVTDFYCFVRVPERNLVIQNVNITNLEIYSKESEYNRQYVIARDFVISENLFPKLVKIKVTRSPGLIMASDLDDRKIEEISNLKNLERIEFHLFLHEGEKDVDVPGFLRRVVGLDLKKVVVKTKAKLKERWGTGNSWGYRYKHDELAFASEETLKEYVERRKILCVSCQ